MNKAVNAVEVCGARPRAQIRVEGVETVPSETSTGQLHTVDTLGPEVIEILAVGLSSVQFYCF